MKLVYALLYGALSIFGCHKNEAETAKPVTDTATIGLHACKEWKAKQTVICFESLTTDNRCPVNTTCIWQGYATVQLTVRTPKAKHAILLSTLTMPGTTRQDTVLDGTRILLRDVKPYPGQPAADQQAVVEVYF